MTDTTTQWRGLHNPEPDEVNLIAEVEALRAQVARVREAVAYAERNYDAPIVTIGAIKIALDGGDA